jgi:hypothetical protein
MHDKVTVGLECSFANSSQKMSTLKLLDYKYGLDFEGWDMGLRRHMSSWCGKYSCLVILKSFNVWQMYSQDMIVCNF